MDTYYIYLDFEVISREFDHSHLRKAARPFQFVPDTLRKHGHL